MTTNDLSKNYQEFKDKFRSMSDSQLIDAFNREVGDSGWTGSRGAYLSALHNEFKNRHYDCAKIEGEEYNHPTFSIAYKIKLVGKKIELEEKEKTKQ